MFGEHDMRTANKKILILFILTCLWISRRLDQVLSAQIWNEEGWILRQSLNEGVLQGIFYPIAGYWMIPTTFIISLTAQLSLTFAPYVFSAFSVLNFLLFATVWLSDRSSLKFWNRVLVVALIVAIPSNSEAFGVALYSFWWLQIISIPTLFWRETLEQRNSWAKPALLILASISGPAGAIFSLGIALNGFVRREQHRKFNVIATGAAVCVQFVTILLTQRSDGFSLQISHIGYAVSKIIGAYFLGLWGLPEFVLIIFGFIVSVASIILSLKFVIQNGITKSILSGPLITVFFIFLAALSSAIVGGPGINQVNVGPRYFFIPFTLIAFMLAYSLGTSSGKWRKYLSLLVIAVTIPTASVWNRSHEDLKWQQQIRNCEKIEPGKDLEIAVQYAGDKEDPWLIPWNSNYCGR